MKKNAIFTLLLAVFLMPAMSASAQRLDDNAIFYHSFRSPLANRLNPALFPSSSKWYVTFPRISAGLSMPLSYNDFGLQYDESRDTTVLNINDLLHTLDSCGSRFNLGADIDIFGFGFSLGRLSINAASGIRISGGMCVPLGATRLLTEGNLGSRYPIEMGTSDFIRAQAYGYASLGAAYTLESQPLTIGARFNLLDGLATLSADNLSLVLTTNDDGQQLQVSADYIMHTAGMAYLEKTSDGEYNIVTDSLSLSNLPAPNWGCTFDLGANFKFGNIDFSASLLDIGPGIHWTNHPTKIVPKNKDVVISFDGLDLSSLLSNGETDTAFGSNLLDSLLNMVDYEEQTTDFWACVPTRLYLGASVHVGSLLRVGYLMHGEWDAGLFSRHSTFRCSNTLSATANLFDWFDVTLANAFTYDGFSADLFNPGVSFSLNIGKVLQFYLAIDYVSNIYATDLKAARFFLGMNIVGKSRK